MFSLDQLTLPIVGAPLAGGPSTPALAAAVTNAGGLGFLAAGYKTPGAVSEDIERVRALTAGAFGLNLFVPERANESADRADPERARAVELYRRRLRAASDDDGALLGAVNPDDDDAWAAKLELTLDLAVPVVSFTFGLPAADVVHRLRRAGICVSITVTDAAEAAGAVRNGADLLCVQGPLAGGHRGTHSLQAVPGTAGLEDLVRQLRSQHSTPIIAAGGIARPEHARAALAAGAEAVQIGTILLRSAESGASDAHRLAMSSAAFTDTALTRAFSGRWARGISNDFLRRHSENAPAAYPEVHQLTKPLRAAAAAAGDPQRINLWSSPFFAEATEEPAGDIVRRLAAGIEALSAD